MTELNLKQLARFLVKAKKKTYASLKNKKVKAWRKKFKEIEYKEGDWYYRDSYAGFFMAPGQEVVYYKGEPVWAMAYAGGMTKQFHGDVDFADKTFTFLKKVLSKVKTGKPFRGPNLKKGDWKYKTAVKGDITDFSGKEKIFYKRKVVFIQYYIGGLIIGK